MGNKVHIPSGMALGALAGLIIGVFTGLIIGIVIALHRLA